MIDCPKSGQMHYKPPSGASARRACEHGPPRICPTPGPRACTRIHIEPSREEGDRAGSSHSQLNSRGYGGGAECRTHRCSPGSSRSALRFTARWSLFTRSSWVRRCSPGSILVHRIPPVVILVHRSSPGSTPLRRTPPRSPDSAAVPRVRRGAPGPPRCLGSPVPPVPPGSARSARVRPFRRGPPVPPGSARSARLRPFRRGPPVPPRSARSAGVRPFRPSRPSRHGPPVRDVVSRTPQPHRSPPSTRWGSGGGIPRDCLTVRCRFDHVLARSLAIRPRDPL